MRNIWTLTWQLRTSSFFALRLLKSPYLDVNEVDWLFLVQSSALQPEELGVRVHDACIMAKFLWLILGALELVTWGLTNNITKS
jgi:hypothetical protein